MRKFITLATAGLFLFSLQPAKAQRQIEPPAIPPMLEGQKPLAAPETTREPAPPKQAEEEKVKPKAKVKAAQKPAKKVAAKKSTAKKASKENKKKAQKNHKKKIPQTGVRHRNGSVVS